MVLHHCRTSSVLYRAIPFPDSWGFGPPRGQNDPPPSHDRTPPHERDVASSERSGGRHGAVSRCSSSSSRHPRRTRARQSSVSACGLALPATWSAASPCMRNDSDVSSHVVGSKSIHFSGELLRTARPVNPSASRMTVPVYLDLISTLIARQPVGELALGGIRFTSDLISTLIVANLSASSALGRFVYLGPDLDAHRRQPVGKLALGSFRLPSDLISTLIVATCR